MCILLDPEDRHLFRHRWRLMRTKSGLIYAWRTAGGRTVYLHRELLGLTTGDGLEVDHLNGNGLDNRRSNVRPVTHAQNLQNIHKEGRGVHWCKTKQRWRARLQTQGRTVNRYFRTREEAETAVRALRAAWLPFSVETP